MTQIFHGLNTQLKFLFDLGLQRICYKVGGNTKGLSLAIDSDDLYDANFEDNS